MRERSLSVFFLLCCMHWGHGAKILAVFPADTSHYFLCHKVVKGLANAGHEITMISSQPTKGLPKNVKVTDIIIPEVLDAWNNIAGHNDMFKPKPLHEGIIMIQGLMADILNATFSNREVQQLIQSKKKFDLVFVEQFENDFLKIFAHLFQAPLAVLCSTGPGLFANYLVGNPSVPSYDPGFISAKGPRMTFFERGQALFGTAALNLIKNFYTMPNQNKLLHEFFPDAPDIWDLAFNTSFVFLNSHTSYVKAVPVVPNMVEIGGYHIDPPQALPEDLKNILDNAKNGAILFSMGSNLKSKDIPEWKRKVILNVFSKLKQTILWKFENDLPGKPDNVIIRQWLPQTDILAHPNVKLFITHGGMLSSTETVFHGVPIMTIPVFGDQFANADRAVQAGYALKLTFSDDANWTEENLYNLISSLLVNPKYTKTVKEISRKFHDRPMKPMETLIYWTEYLIRHKGAPHLRVGGVGMPLIQYFCLDVIAFVLGIALISLYLTWFVIKKICCRRSTKTQDYKKVKKN